MVEFIETLRLFIVDHRSLEFIIIFGGALLGGEFALFTFGFFTAQGVLPIWPVVILSFLATFPPNVLWFLLGQTAIAEKVFAHRYANNTISMIVQAVTKVSRGSHVIGLIFIKFLVGTPFILTMYVNKTRINFWQFIVYETPAILLSLLVILPVGFLSGLGFTYFANIFNNLYVGFSFLLLVIIMITIVQLWFKKKFTKMEN